MGNAEPIDVNQAMDSEILAKVHDLPTDLKGEVLSFIDYVQHKADQRESQKVDWNNLPIDDEPFTDDQKEQVKQSLEEYKQGKFKSLDDFAAELGFNL